MRNWDGILAARTRHGNFQGQGRDDETAYYEFFSGDAVDGPPAPAKRAATWLKALLSAASLVRLKWPDAVIQPNMQHRP